MRFLKISLYLLFIHTIAFSANFTPGNIVVVRVGDGSAALTNAAQPVFLDEYTPAGTLVQSIALPVSAVGNQLPLTMSGTATSEGALTRSANGQLLLLAGYGTAPGTSSVSSDTTLIKVIAVVGVNGIPNTTTGIAPNVAYKKNNIRGAASVDGTGIWTSGAGSNNSGGTWYIPFGSVSSNPVQVSSAPTNTRCVNIFDNQLYITSSSGGYYTVASVGSGTPTNTGNTTSVLNGLPNSSTQSSYAFLFLDMNPAIPGSDVLYLCDDRTVAPDGGIYKFSLVNGAWVSNGNITNNRGVRGITGFAGCSGATLYVTTDSAIFRLQDVSGYNQNITGNLTNVAVAGANTRFRGVSFTPGTNAPAALQLSFNITNVSCTGQSNGVATVVPSGGTGPYTYNWGGGITSATRTNLSSGSYNVTVTDASGCTASGVAQINQPAPINITPSITNVTCHGGNNGAISLSASGGTGAITYNWGGGIAGSSRTNLTAGSYSVTATDANGCTVKQTYSITQPSPISITSNVTNLPCQGGGNTGAINIYVTGGTAPYNFAWSNGAFTQNISNLGLGTYTLTVTDQNNCTQTATFNISQAGNLNYTATVNNISCHNTANGSITLTPTGGTAPYNFNWSNGALGASIANLSPGTYSVTLTDAVGCVISGSFDITQPAPITVNIGKNNPTCFGSDNGEITLTVNGGVAPYTYAWNNGNNSADNENLSAGNYSFTITDNNACTFTGSVTLTSPDSISISANITPTSPGTGNGIIALTVTGGTPGYTYLWDNGANTSTITNLAEGNYCVTITDAANCTKSLCFQVDETVSISETGDMQNIVAYVHNHQITIATPVPFPNTIACLTSVNGQILAHKTLNPDVHLHQIETGQITSGLYILTILNDNRCWSRKIIITH